MSSRFFRRRIRLITILSDLVLINLAFMVAYVVRYQFQWLRPVLFSQPYGSYLGQQILFMLLALITYSQMRVWNRRRGEFWIDEVARIGYATAAAYAMLVTITFFWQPQVFSRLLFGWVLFFTVVFIALARLLRRFLLGLLYQRGVGVDHALVVGNGEVGRGVIRTLLARPDLGFRAVGYLDDGCSQNNIGSGRMPHLGTWSDLPRILGQWPKVNTVFIALPATMHENSLRLVRLCQQAGIRPHVVPDLFELSLSRIEFSNMAGIPVFSVRDLRISPYGRAAKRAIDLTLALLAAIPGLLLAVLIGLAIKLDSPGPVLFSQRRIGKDGKPFLMLKFRSMVVNAEDQQAILRGMNEASGPIFKIREDPRLTTVGRVLRRFSLDEIPQLLNVIRGEMSFVGPRPPLPDEVAQYQGWHRQRLMVRGGMTGLWQVSGRSDLTFDEQCLLDIYYIENWSLAFDLRLILQTIPHILAGRGAY